MRFHPDRYQVVCTDMDGTLVDTEGVYAEARSLAFEELHGFRPTREESLAAIGLSDHIAIGQMLAKRGIVASIEELFQRTNKLYLDLIANQPIEFPGTRAFLARVAEAKLPLALVTSAPRIQAYTILRILDIRDAFRTIVTLEDVTHPKPHPSPYILACERVGVSGARALVIEDSLPGIQSGKAAGATVIAVGDQPREEADYSVQSLDDIHFECE